MTRGRLTGRERSDLVAAAHPKTAVFAPAVRTELSMPIVNRIADMQAEVAAWRRDIHAHPEIMFDVQRTAASVAEKLKAFGCDEAVTGIDKTGVVWVISGKGQVDGRVIGLRAYV